MSPIHSRWTSYTAIAASTIPFAKAPAPNTAAHDYSIRKGGNAPYSFHLEWLYTTERAGETINQRLGYAMGSRGIGVERGYRSTIGKHHYRTSEMQ